MRWIYRIVGVLALVVVAAVVAVFLIPADRIAALVEDRFEAATGRALSIDGDVRPGLWPQIGVRTGPVRIANAGWAGDAPMVAAEDVAIDLAWGGLFGGNLRVTRVRIEEPEIRLQRNAEGAGNWAFDLRDSGGGATGTAGGDGSVTLAVDRVEIENGRVIWQDAGAAPIVVEGISVEAGPAPDGSGQGLFAFRAEANGRSVHGDGVIEDPAALVLGISEVGLVAGSEGMKLTYNGTLGLSPVALEGRLTGSATPLSSLTALFGTPGDGADPDVAVEADVTYSGDRLSARKAVFYHNDAALRGDGTVDLGGDRPRIAGALSGQRLDLSGSGDAEGGGSAGESGSGWSKEPIDVGWLGHVDADVDLSLGEVVTSKSRFGPMSLNLALNDRRLVTTITSLTAYDGRVSGQTVINGRGGLSASADLTGSAIAISRLFAELLDFDRLISLGDMEIEVLGSGNSMYALMNSLNGGGSFRFGAGQLLGLDLAAMLRNLDPSLVGEGRRTIFDEITGTFRIVDGVVINENLRMTAPLFTATGAGEIGVGGRTLNYRLVPRLLGSDEGGVSVPVRITGTWDNPRFVLDFEGLVRDRARQEIERKVQEKIGGGLRAAPGKSAEDAVKDKLEEKLKEGLKSLFD